MILTMKTTERVLVESFEFTDSSKDSETIIEHMRALMSDRIQISGYSVMFMKEDKLSKAPSPKSSRSSKPRKVRAPPKIRESPLPWEVVSVDAPSKVVDAPSKVVLESKEDVMSSEKARCNITAAATPSESTAATLERLIKLIPEEKCIQKDAKGLLIPKSAKELEYIFDHIEDEPNFADMINIWVDSPFLQTLMNSSLLSKGSGSTWFFGDVGLGYRINRGYRFPYFYIGIIGHPVYIFDNIPTDRCKYFDFCQNTFESILSFVKLRDALKKSADDEKYPEVFMFVIDNIIADLKKMSLETVLR